MSPMHTFRSTSLLQMGSWAMGMLHSEEEVKLRVQSALACKEQSDTAHQACLHRSNIHLCFSDQMDGEAH